ncbi:MAG: DUF3060 domain-containing protein [Planctomycetaceae bacterium]|nr:DUF3060 domain-containing protein [Planctomycetaceae bacterium]
MLSKKFGLNVLLAVLSILSLFLIANSNDKILLGDDTITTASVNATVTPENSQPNSVLSEVTPAAPVVADSSTNSDADSSNKIDKLPQQENIIYVPYEKFDRNFGVKDGGVFVKYDEYKRLWEAAQKNQKESEPFKLPIDAMITEMSGIVKVSDDIVQVESIISIELLKDGWREIPIRLGNVAIVKAEINGEAAKIIGDPNKGYKLIIEKKKTENSNSNNKNKNEVIPQRLQLILHFAKGISKSPGQNSVSFQIPQTPLSRWTVIIPESDVKINLLPSIAASAAGKNEDENKKEENSKQTILHAFVGAVPEIRIAWTPKSEGATGLDALISAQIQQQTIIDEGIYRTSADVEYSISRAAISSLAITVPADQKVVRVTDSNIKKWEVTTKDKIQTINIDLFEPAKERQLVHFELEKLFDFKEQQDQNDKSQSSIKLTIPELVAINAGRQQGIITVSTSSELSCEIVNTTGLLRMDLSELPKNLQSNKKLDAIYRITSPAYNFEVAINKVKPRITVDSQAIISLEHNNIAIDNLLIFNIEQAGLFQIKLHVPATFKNYYVNSYGKNNFSGAQIDSFTVDPIKGNEQFKLMTIALSKKAIGKVGLIISGHHNSVTLDNKKTGELFELPVMLPTMPKEFAERFTGKLMLQIDESFRINPIEMEGIQPVSIQQISDKEWMLSKTNARSGFLFSQEIVSFKIQAEKRKPQLTLKEIRHVRVESGTIKHHVKFNYNIQFSGLNSIRIDLPEQVSGRINLNRTANNLNYSLTNWRESKIVPPPEDVEKGYVAWEFSRNDKVQGTGNFDFSWEDVIAQPEIGKSIDITIPRLIPHKQQPADRIWGQVIISKSESIDLGESEKSNGLKPIDPQNDITQSDRISDAIAAFEFYDNWQLELIATRYKLEDVKRTSIERGIIRTNLFMSKKGTGISAQALFKIRSVQQRLEMTLDEAAKISEIRINNRRVPLESDSTAKYMIPLTSITPDTPFLLDVRYTVEPPSKNKITIPTFPTSESDTNKTTGAAIQKADLFVSIPDNYFIIGYKGNWTKEFSYQNQSFEELAIQPKKYAMYETKQLYDEFNITKDDFQIVGNEFCFSTIHPDNNTSLNLRLLNSAYNSIFFAVMVLYGLLTIKIPFIKWIQITIAIIIVCVFAGFIMTTFTEYLATLSAIYFGIVSIIICRMLACSFWLRKKYNDRKNTREIISEQTTNPSDNTVTVSNDNTVTVSNDNTVTVSNDNTVTNNQEGEKNNEN